MGAEQRNEIHDQNKNVWVEVTRILMEEREWVSIRERFLNLQSQAASERRVAMEHGDGWKGYFFEDLANIEIPEEESPEGWKSIGELLMRREDYASAADAFLKARELALKELQLASDKGDTPRVIFLTNLIDQQLRDQPGKYGDSRLEHALCYRRRIAALRELVSHHSGGRNQRGRFAELRYSLALHSLPEEIVPQVKGLIEQIVKAEGHTEQDYHKISEAVFSHIVILFNLLDPDGEKELIQVYMSLPDDPSFEANKTLSRPRNFIALEERIKSHYQRVFNNEYSQTLFSKYSQFFNELASIIRSAPCYENLDWSVIEQV